MKASNKLPVLQTQTETGLVLKYKNTQRLTTL